MDLHPMTVRLTGLAGYGLDLRVTYAFQRLVSQELIKRNLRWGLYLPTRHYKYAEILEVQSYIMQSLTQRGHRGWT